MAFVKFGVEGSINKLPKAEITVDGVMWREYADMAKDRRDLITLVNKLLTCCDEERDAAVMQEAHALLARIKGE